MYGKCLKTGKKLSCRPLISPHEDGLYSYLAHSKLNMIRILWNIPFKSGMPYLAPISKRKVSLVGNSSCPLAGKRWANFSVVCPSMTMCLHASAYNYTQTTHTQTTAGVVSVQSATYDIHIQCRNISSRGNWQQFKQNLLKIFIKVINFLQRLVFHW